MDGVTIKSINEAVNSFIATKPTAQLRFRIQQVSEGPDRKSKPKQILQQLWQTYHYEGDNVKQITEEWIDVPVVDF